MWDTARDWRDFETSGRLMGERDGGHTHLEGVTEGILQVMCQVLEFDVAEQISELG